MINNFFIALYGALMSYFAGFQRRVAAPARGANFIEYAMLGAIAVFLGFIFRKALGDAFSSILNTITGGLGDAASKN